jgi:hypothetical protein
MGKKQGFEKHSKPPQAHRGAAEMVGGAGGGLRDLERAHASVSRRIISSGSVPEAILPQDGSIPTINIINKSALLKKEDFDEMVDACSQQFENHVAPTWMKGTWCLVSGQPESVGYPIIIVDDPDQAGMLGYHTETPDGKIWGRVFVKAITARGGKMTQGPLSVSVVLSHEIIEAYVNPNVNVWASRSDGLLVAYEAADPVENDSYEITTKTGKKVSVSNFVFPEWFDARPPNGARFDFMGKVSKPFSVSKGGYMVTLNTKTGRTKNIFGSLSSKEQHNVRQDPHPASRSTRLGGIVEHDEDEIQEEDAPMTSQTPSENPEKDPV